MHNKTNREADVLLANWYQQLHEASLRLTENYDNNMYAICEVKDVTGIRKDVGFIFENVNNVEQDVAAGYFVIP